MGQNAGLTPNFTPTHTTMTGRTLYDKLWDAHVVHTEEDGTSVLYIDLTWCTR